MKRLSAVLAMAAVLLIPGAASAHVVVTPDSANVGEYVTFNVSVPNEKEVDVTGLKLDIPDGVVGATPTVKSGWTIATDKSGEGESAAVHSITWSDGTIPAGLRDDFTFRAQVPAKSTQINWKAHQTYADGTTVNWDQTPSDKETEGETSGPYSVTKVVDDLAATDKAAGTDKASASSSVLPTALAAIALLVAVVALVRKNKA